MADTPARIPPTGEAALALYEAIEAYVEYVFSDEYHDDGAHHYQNAVFESAVETLYGPGVWDKISDAVGVRH